MSDDFFIKLDTTLNKNKIEIIFFREGEEEDKDYPFAMFGSIYGKHFLDVKIVAKDLHENFDKIRAIDEITIETRKRFFDKSRDGNILTSMKEVENFLCKRYDAILSEAEILSI